MALFGRTSVENNSITPLFRQSLESPQTQTAPAQQGFNHADLERRFGQLSPLMQMMLTRRGQKLGISPYERLGQLITRKAGAIGWNPQQFLEARLQGQKPAQMGAPPLPAGNPFGTAPANPFTGGM